MENYYEGYNESINNLKNNPDIQELDKLCYLTFNTENGQELLKALEKRFVLPALAKRNTPNYTNELIFCEGFKEAYRFLMQLFETHKQYINQNQEGSK